MTEQIFAYCLLGAIYALLFPALGALALHRKPYYQGFLHHFKKGLVFYHAFMTSLIVFFGALVWAVTTVG